MNLDKRLLHYLQNLNAKSWEEPSDQFYGRVGYRIFPALELAKRGQPVGTPAIDDLFKAVELLTQRKDCQDFVMVGLIRLLYRYHNSPCLTPEHIRVVEEQLQAAKWSEEDPQDDSCCWNTENHQLQYASSEYLAGQRYPDLHFKNTGKLGLWHKERAREKLDLWLDWRQKFSFSEWNSSCYYDEDGTALLNLIDFCEDLDLRRRAQDVFELLLTHLAHQSWKGHTGSSQGRSYLPEQILPYKSPMAILAQVCWGEGLPPTELSLTATAMACSPYRIPEHILEKAQIPSTAQEIKEVHGLDADQALEHGVDPSRSTHFPFFSGAGQSHHPLVVETRYTVMNGIERWDGDLQDHRYYQKQKRAGVKKFPWIMPHALGQAHLYTYKTEEYMMGCVQDYHPGAPGYQQFLWSATLGEKAVVFTTNPCPPHCPFGRPGPWIGNGSMPKILQHKNLLLAIYRVQAIPIYDQAPWFREDRVHAYFPKDAFDEVHEENDWCFGRKGQGYIAIRCNQPAHWLPPSSDVTNINGLKGKYEWNVDQTHVVWVCEMGSHKQDGSFKNFIDLHLNTSLVGDTDHFTYISPYHQRVEAGWDKDFKIQGQVIPTRYKHTYEANGEQRPFGVRP